MALIDHIDGPNRRIYLTVGTVSLTDMLALYREYRALRRTVESLRQYSPMMSIIGGQSKGGGKLVGRVLDLHNSKLVPADVSHALLVTYEIIDSQNGVSGRDCFDRAPLTPGVTVDIDYAVSPVEIQIVYGGEGGAPTDPTEIANAVWSKTVKGKTTGTLLSKIAAVHMGESRGLNPGHASTVQFDEIDGSGVAVTGEVDSKGNRTAVTVNP